MTKNILSILFLFILGNNFSINSTPQTAPWILGSLCYEGSFKNLTVPLYYEGNKIVPYLNKQKKLDFEIPRSRKNQIYYIIITEEVIPVAKKSAAGQAIINTIDYLRVPKENNYRLFQLHLTSEMITNQKGQAEKIYYWEITEMVLPETGQLPQQTLIIYDLPERVLSFDSGGSLLSWPTIYMHTPDENNAHFRERLTKMHLSVPNLNTIHVPIKKTYSSVNHNKRVITYSC